MYYAFQWTPFDEKKSLLLIKSHFKLNQLQDEALEVQKPHECNLRNENLHDLPVL